MSRNPENQSDGEPRWFHKLRGRPAKPKGRDRPHGRADHLVLAEDRDDPTRWFILAGPVKRREARRIAEEHRKLGKVRGRRTTPRIVDVGLARFADGMLMALEEFLAERDTRIEEATEAGYLYRPTGAEVLAQTVLDRWRRERGR